MKIKLLVCLLVSLLAVSAFALPRQDDRRAANTISEQVDNNTYVDANRILMFVTNHGNFGRDLSGVFGYDYGTWFPFSNTQLISDGGVESQWSPLYAAGLWVGGVDATTGDTVLSLSEYSSEYVPGPMVGGTFSPDVPEYRVYKLYRDSLAGNPNQDYLDWPVDQGAPVVRDSLGEIVLDINGLPTPEMIGDQMLWSVFNDADPDQHIGQVDAGETDPIGIEVKQTIFAFTREGSLGNMVFFRLRVYNKGSRTLNNCYMSLWADPDVGSAGDDLVGCDTTIDLGFAYNSDNSDPQYDPTTVPCLGFDFFQGPLVDSPGDVGIMWGDTAIPDVRNLGMVSFNKYINGTDPDNYQETYLFMQGFDGKTGEPYVYNNDTLLYQKSGDPVAGTGDIDDAPADRRFMQSTGPITFAPGDSTEIIAAIIVGQGSSNLNSITVMKQLDVFAQKLYPEFDPPKPPVRPQVNVAELPGQINLIWGDTSEVDPGDFTFEGYTIWQGASPNGPWTELATYDLDNDRGALVDTFFDAESGLNLPRVMRVGRNSGLTYRYEITRDALNNTPLRDLTEYYFRVTAYSYDEINPNDSTVIPAGDRFLESSTVLTVVPQSPIAGTDFGAGASQVLDVTHVGPGDGSVQPIVLDPLALTGHTYQVIFESVGPGEYVWHLRDATAGTFLLEDQTNQSGNEVYVPVDGMVVKVVGPDPGVKPGDMFAQPDDPSAWGWDIPAGTRRFTWANADGFGWEGFRGAIGWGGPGDTHGFGTYDPVDPSTLPNVELRLATVDEDGNFNPADPNVSYAYRFIRGKSAAPAQPEFAAFYTQSGASYDFEDFELSCPLSAWDMDTDPPTRLTVGYLENNATFAVLDGKYFPRESDDFAEGGPAAGSSNTDGGGPREWLWIYQEPYSTTVNPAYTGNSIDDPHPIMYWLTVNRRGSNVPFSPDSSGQDVFLIIPSRVNTPADTFTFTAPSATVATTEDALDKIKPVPNPFYLFGNYDKGPGNKVIKFHHMPAQATITIYNLAGERVRTIDHETGAIAEWNALTDQGLPVASGIYIYVVDAPGYGQKIGKMAVFTEQEVLQIY